MCVQVKVSVAGVGEGSCSLCRVVAAVVSVLFRLEEVLELSLMMLLLLERNGRTIVFGQ